MVFCFELFGMLVCLGFSDDTLYICLIDKGYKLSKNWSWIKEFFLNFASSWFHTFFYLSKKEKRQENFLPFFVNYLVIFGKYFGSLLSKMFFEII
jgi:hypothetical protein